MDLVHNGSAPVKGTAQKEVRLLYDNLCRVLINPVLLQPVDPEFLEQRQEERNPENSGLLNVY